jgi:hypothetical protein
MGLGMITRPTSSPRWARSRWRGAPGRPVGHLGRRFAPLFSRAGTFSALGAQACGGATASSACRDLRSARWDSPSWLKRAWRRGARGGGGARLARAPRVPLAGRSDSPAGRLTTRGRSAAPIDRRLPQSTYQHYRADGRGGRLYPGDAASACGAPATAACAGSARSRCRRRPRSPG